MGHDYDTQAEGILREALAVEHHCSVEDIDDLLGWGKVIDLMIAGLKTRNTE